MQTDPLRRPTGQSPIPMTPIVNGKLNFLTVMMLSNSNVMKILMALLGHTLNVMGITFNSAMDIVMKKFPLEVSVDLQNLVHLQLQQILPKLSSTLPD